MDHFHWVIWALAYLGCAYIEQNWTPWGRKKQHDQAMRMRDLRGRR